MTWWDNEARGPISGKTERELLHHIARVQRGLTLADTIRKNVQAAIEDLQEDRGSGPPVRMDSNEYGPAWVDGEFEGDVCRIEIVIDRLTTSQSEGIRQRIGDVDPPAGKIQELLTGLLAILRKDHFARFKVRLQSTDKGNLAIWSFERPYWD